MTSADFLAHRKQVYSKISPGKTLIFPPISATSTQPHNSARPLQWCACSTTAVEPLYVVSVRQNRGLPFGFLQSMNRFIRPCHLLVCFAARPPAGGDLHPQDNLSIFQLVPCWAHTATTRNCWFSVS